MKPMYDVSSNEDIADSLGAIRAEIASLKAGEKLLEDMLKDRHVVATVGKKFAVTISYAVSTTRVNWKLIAEKIGFSHQLKAAHSTVTVSDRVRVTAHNKS